MKKQVSALEVGVLLVALVAMSGCATGRFDRWSFMLGYLDGYGEGLKVSLIPQRPLPTRERRRERVNKFEALADEAARETDLELAQELKALLAP